ncbi:MAG: sodium-dependent transporter, partial [Pseudomonadales bacterium]
AVISGWVLAYLLQMASGAFVGIDGQGATAVFNDLQSDALGILAWFTGFMALTVWISGRGVGEGLEVAVKYLMPTLFGLLLLLVVWAAFTSGHFMEGFAFLFSFKAEQFSADGVLMAMGQAFFTLSLGMGAMMAYGAYLPAGTSIFRSVTAIALLDTTVAVLAGLAIFPLVFANGLEASAGPGLMFVTLPIAFGQMAGGQLFGTLFFVLVSFAAITSAISLVEPCLAWLVEKLRVSRMAAAMLIGAVTWVVGLGSAFSFNILSDFYLLPGKTYFDTMDFVANNIILPLGGLLIALFAGWVLERSILREQLGEETVITRVWLLLARFVAPAAVGLVFVMALV